MSCFLIASLYYKPPPDDIQEKDVSEGVEDSKNRQLENELSQNRQSQNELSKIGQSSNEQNRQS